MITKYTSTVYLVRVVPNEHFFRFIGEFMWTHVISLKILDLNSHKFTGPKSGPLNSCEVMCTRRVHEFI